MRRLEQANHRQASLLEYFIIPERRRRRQTEKTCRLAGTEKERDGEREKLFNSTELNERIVSSYRLAIFIFIVIAIAILLAGAVVARSRHGTQVGTICLISSRLELRTERRKLLSLLKFVSAPLVQERTNR